MSAREKMRKAERVPDALLSRFNAARADFLETVAEAQKRVQAFAAETQKAVLAARDALKAREDEIAKALGLDAAKGDKFDPSTGAVKRAEAAK